MWIKENIDQYSGKMCFARWTRNLEFIVTAKMFSNEIYRYNCGLRDYVWNYKQQTCLFEIWQTQEYHNTVHKKLHQTVFNFTERIVTNLGNFTCTTHQRRQNCSLCYGFLGKITICRIVAYLDSGSAITVVSDTHCLIHRGMIDHSYRTCPSIPNYPECSHSHHCRDLDLLFKPKFCINIVTESNSL